MKYIIFIFIIFGFFCNCNNSLSKGKKTVVSKNKNDKTAAELYKESLDTLDSIRKYSITNEDFDGIESIKILSEISGYEGSGNKNYYGTIGFKDEDLAYWKEWFKKNKDSLGYLFHIQSSYEYALNIDKYYVEKIDSTQNFYLLYLKKANNYYKVVSEKVEKSDKCENVKKGDYLTFSLNSIIEISTISYKVDGVLYKGTEFIFDRDSIVDLYESNNLMGLCYLKKKY
jgi:hypothetical protein